MTSWTDPDWLGSAHAWIEESLDRPRSAADRGHRPGPRPDLVDRAARADRLGRRTLSRRTRAARARPMSTIAVVTSSPPLAEGGHLVIARSLVTALRDAGHHADIVVTTQNRFGRNLSSYLANRLTDVGRTADGRHVDQVISLRWPSYAVRHPAHVSWLNHTAREYYDLWERFSARLLNANRVKEQVRRSIIQRTDSWLLRSNVTRLVAQSKTVQARLRRFNGLESEVVYPPAPQRAYPLRPVRAVLFRGLEVRAAEAAGPAD